MTRKRYDTRQPESTLGRMRAAPVSKVLGSQYSSSLARWTQRLAAGVVSVVLFAMAYARLDDPDAMRMGPRGTPVFAPGLLVTLALGAAVLAIAPIFVDRARVRKEREEPPWLRSLRRRRSRRSGKGGR